MGSLVCVLQLVPVPSSLQELASPTSWAHFAEGWKAMFGESSPEGVWRRLTLEPAQTAAWGMRWIVFASLSWLAVREATATSGFRNILRAVVVAGVSVLCVGGVQTLAGTSKVLFLYEPTASIRPWTTFVNSNHAGSFYLFCAMCAVFAALKAFPEDHREGLLTVAAAILFVWGGFKNPTTASTFAFLACIGLGVFLVVASDRHVVTRARRALTFGVLGSIGCLFMVLFAQISGVTPGIVNGWLSENLPLLSWSEWQSELQTRLNLTQAALAATQDFWLLGAGAGAIEIPLAQHIDWAQVRSASVPTSENQFADWLLEYGILAGLLMGILVLSTVIFARLRFKNRARERYIFAICAAIYLVFITLFHFPFTALGLSLPIVVAFQVAAFPVRSRELDGSGAKFLWRRGLVAIPEWGAKGAICGGWVLLIVFGGTWAAVSFGEASSPSSSKALAKAVRTTPARGTLYADAGIQALNEERPDVAVRRGRHAFAVEPRANIGLTLGQIHGRAGMPQESARTFRKVFSEDYSAVRAEWALEYVVPTLKTPEWIARALSDARPHTIRTVARRLNEDQGPSAAANFGMTLADEAPKRPIGYSIAIQNFQRMDQMLLAELWAERLLDAMPRGFEEGREAGYASFISILRKRGQVSEARTVSIKALAELPHSTDVAIQAAAAITSTNDSASDSEVRAVKGALPKVCYHRGRNWRERLCWQTEAWVAEQKGDLDAAGAALRRLAVKHGRAQDYLEFLLRHEKCSQMSDFLASEDSPEGDYSRFLSECGDD